MIKWYYKIRKAILPVIVLIVAACFIVIPLSIFFFQESTKDEVVIDKPELKYKMEPKETVVDSGEFEGDDIVSNWSWTYDLSDFDGFEIEDYFVVAIKQGGDSFLDNHDSEGNWTMWADKPEDGDWTETMLWDQILVDANALDDAAINEYNNELNANIKPWLNDGSQGIKGLSSSSMGFSIIAGVSATKVNDNNVPINFDRIVLGPTKVATQADKYTKYISAPELMYIDSLNGTAGGIFVNSGTIYANPYDYSLWPRVLQNSGVNTDYGDTIYDVVPHINANIYYDLSPTEYVVDGEDKYNPEEDYLIKNINTDQVLSNGAYIYESGVVPMDSNLYDENAKLIDLDPLSFKIDIEFNYKFKPINEIKEIMNADYLKQESDSLESGAFDYITDYNNPEEYRQVVNHLTINEMEWILDAFSIKMIPDSLSTIIATNDIGYTQISMTTRDDYIFSSDLISPKDYSISMNMYYFDDLNGPDNLINKWLSFSSFARTEIDEEDYAYVSTDTIPKIFPTTSQYFIDPNSTFTIERDTDDNNYEYHWTVGYGNNSLRYYFEQDEIELINYDSKDDIPDLIPAEGETGLKIIAPNNVHYRNIEHDYSSELMIIIIVLLVLVLLVPITISFIVRIIKNRIKE